MNTDNETKGKVIVTPAEWERRRYEIARDILPAIYTDGVDELFLTDIVRDAVRLADLLIKELKQ